MKDKSLTFASMIAAGVASLCCIGPLVAVGLGVGTFGTSALFEGLRPYLLGLTAMLLAGAFYLSYRKVPAAECVDGSCAVSPEKKRKQRALLWISTAAVAAFAAFPHYSGFVWSGMASAQTTAFAASKDEAKAVAVIAVEGMTCAGCAAGMKATLEREEGVASAEVDYEKASSRVRFDPIRTSVEKLIAAIGEMGCSAKLTERQS
jgi:mercuric ion transport protein